MRILFAGIVMLAAAQAAQAEDAKPQNAQWQLQSCKNPGLSYDVKKAAVSGSVSALFDIETDGRVSNIRVQNPDNNGNMTRYVTNALRRWRYFAYIKNGQETKRTDVPVTFTYSREGKQSCTHTLLPVPPSTAGDPKDPLLGVKMCPQLIYPELAYGKEWAGTVKLGYDVTPEGDVADVVITGPSDYPLLNDKAASTLKRWQYQPFIKEGKPVARKGLSVNLRFSMSLPPEDEDNSCLDARPANTMNFRKQR